MKLIMVGELTQPEEAEELVGKSLVILTGTIDEVRAAGALLYEAVNVVRSPLARVGEGAVVVTPALRDAGQTMHGWTVLRGQTVVMCPGCGFTMGIEHESEGDSGPLYDCPNCGDSASAGDGVPRVSEGEGQ